MTKCAAYFLLFIWLVIMGCSKAEPVSVKFIPSVPAKEEFPQSESMPSIFPSVQGGISGNVIIGAYEGSINTESMEYHFAPLRTSQAIGDSFQVDLTYYLDGIPCGNCLRIGQIKINEDENLEITFQARHPFSNTANRLDLPVFDVRGIMVNKNPNLTTFPNIKADINSDGSPETSVAGDISYLLNPDGYSTFFDIVSETYLGLSIQGNLNPHRMFFTNPANGNFNASSPNGVDNVSQITGHNVFAQGTSFDSPGASQVYILNGGIGTVFDFVFILDGAYGHSATFQNTYYHNGEPGARNSPKFFVPEFNRKEAWKVAVEIAENDLAPYDSFSSFQIQVSACDWQAGLSPVAEWSEDVPFDSVRHASDVESVTVDIPGILNNSKQKNLSEASGVGSNTNPYMWTFNLTNETGAESGNYHGIVCVRDEICSVLDGVTPPLGVKQDSTTVDFRDFATYYVFDVEIPGFDGVFQADPNRRNLDLITGVTQPTSAEVSLDLAVVESDNPDIQGVYMCDANNQITRYDVNYIDAHFHGPGLLPINDTGTHPSPSTAMMMRRLDANSHGVTGAAYLDANESFAPNNPDPPVLPAGNILQVFYCVIPPPDPPYGSEYPLTRFAGYLMTDSDDPQTPGIDEYEEEDPIPIDVWEDFDGSLGAVWETTKHTNSSSGLYDTLYFGTSFSYPPNPANPPTSTPQFSVSLSGIPSNEIRGVDRSDNGYIYYAFSGSDTFNAWGYESLLAGLDSESPGTSPIIGGIPIYSGNVIDMELLPYDDSISRTINGIAQTAPIAVCLTSSKTIEFIDTLSGSVIQVINASTDGSISGIPQFVDVGDRSFTVHVTHLDGSTPRVTVFYLK